MKPFRVSRVSYTSGFSESEGKNKWKREEVTVEVEVLEIGKENEAYDYAKNFVEQKLKMLKPRMNFELDKLSWLSMEGPRGPYEVAVPHSNVEEFEKLKNALISSRHLEVGEYFLWIFNDNVARKKVR
jgi:hypothetical protein